MTTKFKPGQRVELDRPPPPVGVVKGIDGSMVFVEWDDGKATWISDLALIAERANAISAVGAPVLAEAFGRTADGGKPPAEANARLIAASPSLFDELDSTTSMLEAVVTQLRAWGHEPVVAVDRQLMDSRAALSRALMTSPTRNVQEPTEAMITEILGFNGSNNVDVRNLCYSAFMNGRSGKNKDDGGPCDWFTDTLPMVETGIEKLRPKLRALAASPSPATAGDGMVEFPAGAIHNGEIFIEHGDWPEVVRCFRYVAQSVQDYAARLAATEAERDALRAEVAIVADMPVPIEGWNHSRSDEANTLSWLKARARALLHPAPKEGE